MSLRNTISEAQKTAMKQGEKQSLSILRMLWSAIRNAEIDTGAQLNDEQIQQVITRQVKQLKDALTDFEKANRNDLQEQTQSEIDFLSQYLPKQLSDEELQEMVQRVVTHFSGEKNIGVLMGAVVKEAQGKADGKRIRECLEKVMAHS